MGVRKIGLGYYGIDASGVTISETVQEAMQAALKRLSSIPAEEIQVRLAEPAESRDAEPAATPDRKIDLTHD